MLKVWHQLREIIVIRNLKTVKYVIPLHVNQEVIGKLQEIVVKSDSIEITMEICEKDILRKVFGLGSL